MNKCPNCDSKLSKKARMCPNCGERNLSSIKETFYSVKVTSVSSQDENINLIKNDTRVIEPKKSETNHDYFKYHYYCIALSVFFSISWIIPSIGFVLSLLAYDDLKNQEESGLKNQKIWTIITAIIHFLYIISSLINN